MNSNPTNTHRFIRLDTLEPINVPNPLWGPLTAANIVNRPASPSLSNSHTRSARITYLLARDGPSCLYCGRDIDPNTCTIEHIVSVSANGPEHASNLCLVHPECNAAAGHLSAVEKLKLALRFRGVIKP